MQSVNRFKFVSKWEVFKEWASNNNLILMLRRCVAYGLQFLLRAWHSCYTSKYLTAIKYLPIIFRFSYLPAMHISLSDDWLIDWLYSFLKPYRQNISREQMFIVIKLQSNMLRKTHITIFHLVWSVVASYRSGLTDHF